MGEALPPFFLYLLKIYHMKLINYLLIALVFVSSCKEENEPVPTFAKDYGDGMYIVTENGVSFYDGEVVKNQIYKEVNGDALSNPKKIKFKGKKAYIVSDNQIVTANVETFENKEIIGGFVNATDFDFVDFDRLFVVDKGDAKVKVVDLVSLYITSDIETGDVTNPSFIISKRPRSFILNSGAVADSLKDSTVIGIDYKDVAIPLADLIGSIEVGDNPNSAVWIGALKILCKGIYDENNLLNNTFSSLSKVDAGNVELDWNVTLPNIYNAKNLVSSSNNNKYFFLALDGVYQMNNDGSGISQKIYFISDILDLSYERYDLTDTTWANVNMLYINDAVNNPNVIYKYNVFIDTFCDTIVVDSPVKDIAFY
jgi:hypothetical protein